MSSLRLSTAVTVGHPSSITINLLSRGTFRRVVTYNACTKLLLRSFVFHSHMSDLLSYLPFVEHWPSTHTTSSSHRSVRNVVRFKKKNLFWQVYYSTTSELIHFVWQLFPVSWSWMQGWGVLFHMYLESISCISSWKCHVTAHVAFPWSSSVETNF